VLLALLASANAHACHLQFSVCQWCSEPWRTHAARATPCATQYLCQRDRHCVSASASGCMFLRPRIVARAPCALCSEIFQVRCTIVASSFESSPCTTWKSAQLHSTQSHSKHANVTFQAVCSFAGTKETPATTPHMVR
jgi:hypothetical protein